MSGIENYKGADEHILWTGTKDKRVATLEGVFNPLAPFAILWALFDAVFIGGFTLSGQVGEMGGFALVLIPFFALHLMPVWIYLAGILTAGLKAKHTAYMITDKNVYFQHGVFSLNVEVKSFAEMSHINIHQGIADKLFHCGDVYVQCHDHTHKIENIADYEAVFKLLQQYQVNIYSDVQYPNAYRPESNPGYQTRAEFDPNSQR